MYAFSFTYCSECGSRLHTTFFCQECGQPSCCLDCYCRHEARHTVKQAAQAEQEAQDSAIHLESTR
jgi:hypothetical protein